MAESDDNDIDSNFEAIEDPTFEPSALRTGLSELYKRRKFSDIVIVVEGQKFDCHKVILSSTSNYFESMFSSGMTESRSNEIILKEVKPEIFSSILEYIYNGRLLINRSDPKYQRAIDTLKTADMLQFFELYQLIIDFFMNKLNPECCLELLSLSDSIEEEALHLQSLDYALRNFQEVSKTDSFLKLHESVLAQYIDNERLYAQNEDDVFFAVARWVEVAPKDRRVHAPELLSKIRYCFIEPVILYDSIQQNALFAEVPEFHKYIREAQRHQVLPCAPSDPHFACCKPRQCHMVTTLVQYTDSNEPLADIHSSYGNTFKFLPYSTEIMHETTITANRLGVPDTIPACILNGTIYAVVAEDLWKYHVSTGPCSEETSGYWIRLASKNHGTSFPTLTPTDNSLYVIGGKSLDYRENVSLIECYDTQTNHWGTVGSLTHAVVGHASVVIDDNIYVLGGARTPRSEKPNTLQIFNTITKHMTAGPDMIVNETYHAACAFNGKIYSFGMGTQMYDPDLKCWTKLLARDNLGRSMQAISVCGSRILIAGGVTRVKADGKPVYTDEIAWYDPEDDQFTCSYDPPLPKTMLLNGALTVLKNPRLRWQ